MGGGSSTVNVNDLTAVHQTFRKQGERFVIAL
jgi:hypothetical protein